MKKYYKVALALLVPLLAVFGIYDYYWTLPIEGAYDTSPISYPTIDRAELKERLSKLDTQTLEKMKHSGLEVVKWQNLLDKVGATVVSELVPDFDPFFAREHYPYDEVYDNETHSLYYYHSHRPGEHGHFHLFFCDEVLLDQHEPLNSWDEKKASAHLLAISVHPDGTPLGLFITNQWVTPKEWWYSKETITDLLDHFEITHPYPSWPTNQWLNHMLVLFRPQIEDILTQRDLTLEESELPLEEALKNKKIEILSQAPVSIEMQLEIIEELLNQ